MHEHEWTELGRIDYFLEHLARAVERGEVPLSSYESIAPRYLERRQEIASVLERVATRAPAPVAAPEVRAHEEVSPPPLLPEPASLPSERAPLSWTTVLIATGAFLVIVAAAVFAIAAWQLVSPGLRFAFLGALTLGFYVAGDRVRTKLGLTTGGVALTVVGSAMLLFDGWILIDGYRLSGPWPFAFWFLLCSGAYWLTETRLRGGFFGITGAAAQIAWWWLLGEGLHMSTEPRLAGIAVVLALWALTARRVDESSDYGSLARVLKVAAPIGAVLVVWAFLARFGLAGGAAEFISATVVAIAVTIIADALDVAPGVSAAGSLPLMMLAGGSPLDQWWHVALFAALAGGYFAYEWRRGGVGHGVLGLFAMIGVAFSLRRVLDLGADTVAAVLIGLAVVWSVASWKLTRLVFAAELQAKRVRILAMVAEVGSWALLVCVALALPLVTIAFPVLGGPATYSDALLAAFAAAALLGGAILHRRPGAPVATLVSLFAAWALLDAALPTLSGPLRAIVLVVIAGAWAFSARPLERSTGFPASALRGVLRLEVAFLLLAGLGLHAWFGALPSWESAALLGAVALWFLLDGVLARVPASLGVAGAAAVGAVAMWLGWNIDGPAAAVGAAFAALAISAIGVAARRVRGAGDWAPWAAVSIAVPVAFFSWHDPAMLGLAFAVCAVSAAIASFASRWLEGVLIAGIVATGAALAFVANAATAPWTTTGVLVALSACHLAPAFFFNGTAESSRGRVVRALACAGVVPLMTAIVLGAWGASFWFEPAGWMALDGHALAVAVAALGVYVLAAGHVFDLEPAPYVGVGLLLVAYWLELSAGSVERIEWYTVPAGVYVAWCGYRWSWRTPGRVVPLVSDLGTAALVLVPPILAMLDPFATEAMSWSHTFWAFGLAMVAVVLGVVLRTRVYFFGGIAALVVTALVRSWTYLVEYWWMVLGLVGIGMIVVALARELRRQMLVGVRDVLEGWH